jgi:hypothetical protein
LVNSGKEGLGGNNMNCESFEESIEQYNRRYMNWLEHKLPENPSFQDLCDWEPYVTLTQLLLIDACPEYYFEVFAPKKKDYKYFGGTNFLG